MFNVTCLCTEHRFQTVSNSITCTFKSYISFQDLRLASSFVFDFSVLTWYVCGSISLFLRLFTCTLERRVTTTKKSENWVFQFLALKIFTKFQLLIHNRSLGLSCYSNFQHDAVFSLTSHVCSMIPVLFFLYSSQTTSQLYTVLQGKREEISFRANASLCRANFWF